MITISIFINNKIHRVIQISDINLYERVMADIYSETYKFIADYRVIKILIE